MLHRISSVCFLLAILIYMAKYIKILKISKNTLLKLHILVGSISIVSMILYSIIDYLKEKESFILMFIPVMIFIGISGNKKNKKQV